MIVSGTIRRQKFRALCEAVRWTFTKGRMQLLASGQSE